MTDEELIAWLREYREINEGSTGVSYDPIPECLAAADCIEALIAAIELVRGHRETLAMALDETQAKLAKAVGALSLCAGHDHDCVSKIQIARATLAEIKPITEWPEETGNIMVGKLKGESHE